MCVFSNVNVGILCGTSRYSKRAACPTELHAQKLKNVPRLGMNDIDGFTYHVSIQTVFTVVKYQFPEIFMNNDN